MPYRFDFDPVNQILRCQISGEVNDQTVTDCYAAVSEFAQQVPHRMALLEFVAITSFEVSTAALAILAATPPAIPDLEEPRFVVAPSDLIYGKCRTFEMLGEYTRPNLHIVRSVDEAYAYFDVRNPQFEPIRVSVTPSAHN